MPPQPKSQNEGVFVRRWTQYRDLFFDEFVPESAWLRESGSVHFPPLRELKRITVRGEFRPHPDASGTEISSPSIELFASNSLLASHAPTAPGPWEISFDIPPDLAPTGIVLTLKLRGTSWTNFLAWTGRITAGWPALGGLQRFRRQNKNRQLRIATIEADGEIAYDFSNRASPYSAAFARKHANLGLNIVGYITADLGIGESARCMLRAADAVKIPATAIQLKLPCKARQGDATYAPFLQDENPHGVNVFHIDAPASRDIDTHHGDTFRRGKYNIAYWAWELPEFPDAWIASFNYFDEIWCPSDFVRDAICAKSPLPVLTMPHAIAFERPKTSVAHARAKFKLPTDQYLFLFLYDLNSYTERKNPRAVIAAFRSAGLAGRGATLVIKVHGMRTNETELAALRASVADLPGVILLTESFSRAEIYLLQHACDCFVSLHRSEGFGLAVAECMFLGKPVISTDWSATAEFLNPTNGCPVRHRLIQLERSHGPYSKGQTWADPDIAHAAEWMQRLFADRPLGQRLGQAARATIETRFSPATIGARYRRRLEAIASW